MAIPGKDKQQTTLSAKRNPLLIAGIVGGIAFFILSCGGSSSPQNSPPPPVQAPAISSISPGSIIAGSNGFTLTVNGSNFNISSTVQWSGSSRPTAYVNDTQLHATISTSDIAAAGTRTITVRNTLPGVAVSNGSVFNINYPTPTISFLSPSSIPAESEGFTLIIYGRNFIENTTLQWNSSDISGDFVDATQIIFTVSSSYITSEGIVSVSVSNPSPGGGSSNTLPFNVKTAGLSVLTKQLPDGYNSRPYTYSLQAEGGISPYFWAVAAGALPGGLFLSPEGVISGTAPVVAMDTSYPFTISLDDSSQPAGSNTILHDLSILVKSGSPERNDACGIATATPISNGILRASISPYGDIDVYSFQGTQGNPVAVELIAQRLDLDEDATSRDVYMDTFLEILDDTCTLRVYNDDIDLGVVYDSFISNYTLPYTGIYFIRISDLRGDGRPDFLYDLSLSGAD